MRPIFAVPLALCALACNRSKAGPADGTNPASSAAPGSSEAVTAMAALPSAMSILNGFEGEIDVVLKENAPGATPLPLALLVKSDKLRADIPEKFASFLGGKAYAILDSAAQKLSVVSDVQKRVIVIDLQKSGEQLKNMHGPERTLPHGGAPPVKPTTRLTETGKFDTVAGQKCENWDVTGDHRDATVCVAQQGGSVLHIPLTGVPTERLWMAELLDGNHFPLRMIAYAKDGTSEASRVEVTQIDKKSLPASAFEYPATYAVTDLAQMFKGMMGFQPAGPAFAGPSGAPPR